MSGKQRRKERRASPGSGPIDDRPSFKGEVRVNGKLVWAGRNPPEAALVKALREHPGADISVSWNVVRGSLIVTASLPVPPKKK